MGAEAVEQTQSRHVLRVTVTLTAGAVIQDLVVAALNVRIATLGDKVAPQIIGGRVITSSAGFTFGDTLALVATTSVSVATAYDDPAVNFLKETFIGGSGTAVISVYYGGPTLLNAAGTALV